jgi:RNA polymerase sigma factor (sigma-70 family)
MASNAARVMTRALRAAAKAVTPGPTDRELLGRFTAGDESAFAELVARHAGMVLGVCRRVLPTVQDAEDACQATFVILANKARLGRWQSSVANWLYTTARRVAAKARLAAERRSARERRAARPEGVSSLDQMTARDVLAALDEELAKLPVIYREPLVLCYLEGLTRDEAATRLGVPAATLKSQLDRGRKKLADALTARGCGLGAGLLALAATSPAGASPSRLVESVLAAVSGTPSAAVATLARGSAMNALLNKPMLAALALTAVLVLGTGGLKLTAAGDRSEKVLPAKGTVGGQTKGGKPDAGEKKMTVSGRVLGADGEAVSGAKLLVLNAGGEAKAAPQAESNADGGFAFELPEYGDRRYLVATAPSLGLGCAWVEIPTRGAVRGAMLKLPTDVPIRGRVVDLEGKPVAGAQVRVTGLQTGKDDTLNEFVRVWSKDRKAQQQAFGTTMGKWLSAPAATSHHFAATTDAQGRFTLAGIGRDRCPRLTVTASGLVTQICLVPLRPDLKPLPGAVNGTPVLGPNFTLPLTPTTPITGVVRDAQKKPVAGVTIRGMVDLNDATDLRGWIIPSQVEAVTDARGRYTLVGLPMGKNYILVASPKAGDGLAHQFASVRSTTPGVKALTANFDLPRGVVLTGRITDKKSGKPVRGYLFYRPLASNQWVQDHPGYRGPGIAPWPLEANVWSDYAGRFLMTAVEGPGILHVQVIGPDRPRDYPTARLDPKDNTDEIVNKKFGHFNTIGQGGLFGPMNTHAYRVLRIPAGAKAFSIAVTVDPG